MKSTLWFIYLYYLYISIYMCVYILNYYLFYFWIALYWKGRQKRIRRARRRTAGSLDEGSGRSLGFSIEPCGGQERGWGSRGQRGWGWSIGLRDRWPQQQGHRGPPGHRGKGQRRSWGRMRRPSNHRGHVWQRALNCFDSVRTIFNYYTQAISNNK